MMFSEFTLIGPAVLLVGMGLLAGWLLRGFIDRSLRGAAGGKARVGREELQRNINDSSRKVGGQVAVNAETVRVSNDGQATAPCVRKTFALALGHRLAESSRRGDPLSMILARLDNYESLAKRHGLQKSNEILEALGKFFIASVRGMDWVARFDAATFAFMLPNTPHAGASLVAVRLRTSLSAASVTKDAALVGLTLSLGTTEFTLGDGSEAILRRAEDAMNNAVVAGGNCIRSQMVEHLETADVA
jgi:diguanylate cyclase (GGDEF)-like protein